MNSDVKILVEIIFKILINILILVEIIWKYQLNT